MNKQIIGMLLVVLAAGMVAACGGGAATETTSGTNTETGATGAMTATENMASPTMEMAPTEAMAATEAMTSTEMMTDTETMGDTDTETMTDTMTSGAMTAAVSFTAPDDGASVTSPVQVCMDVTGITLAPKGTMEPGTGHLHVLVDPSAAEAASIKAGEAVTIGEDDSHIHLGDGSSCKDIELTAGEHTLMAVVADGNHVNLSPAVTAEITVTAE
jgi:hypothetical protein